MSCEEILRLFVRSTRYARRSPHPSLRSEEVTGGVGVG